MKSIIKCLVVILVFGINHTVVNADSDLYGTERLFEKQGGRVEVIKFDQGVKNLTKNQKTDLQETLNAVRKGHVIEKVIIAAWSDKKLPVNSNLSNEDTDLAAARLESVKTIVQDMFVDIDIDAYNLSERANWFENAFNTDDSKLKSLFKNDKNAPVDEPTFYSIRKNGGPSKVVLMIKRKKVAKS